MDRTDKYAFKNREGAPNIPVGVVAAASTLSPTRAGVDSGPGSGPRAPDLSPALDLRA
jgi:hypothetical protein